jgi:hypothetical protein
LIKIRMMSCLASSAPWQEIARAFARFHVVDQVAGRFRVDPLEPPEALRFRPARQILSTGLTVLGRNLVKQLDEARLLALRSSFQRARMRDSVW